MKIIREGTRPEIAAIDVPLYCDRCNAMFSLESDDLDLIHVHHLGDWVACPTCGNKVYLPKP